jgi:glycosyltransferase involved in cell wall biosynthesis
MSAISIIIPAYNEQEILITELERLVDWLRAQPQWRAEVLIIENGSTDDTSAIADKLAERFPEVKAIHQREASFGKAVQAGLLAATHPLTILLNADWIDTDFIRLAVRELAVNDIVVGSKVLDPTADKRPLTRKLLSRLLTVVIKRLFNFKGSDSHGLKAFRTPVAQQLAADCQTHEIIETELLVKAQWLGHVIVEVPVGIEEMRPPRQGLTSRSLVMARELYRLRKQFKRTMRTAKR